MCITNDSETGLSTGTTSLSRNKLTYVSHVYSSSIVCLSVIPKIKYLEHRKMILIRFQYILNPSSEP
jgi:hypothetical protein